ncbi:MAG: protein translocase subunit SecF [Candidatus Caenarcaniphilales bacterium]|nr:protein translocase subunit SecF [Candidatus Caenarcaniphilales bacterium]
MSEKSPKNSSSQIQWNAPQIVEKAPIWASISGILIVVSLIAIIYSFSKFGAPVKLGLDFLGGTKIEYSFIKSDEKLTSGNVRDRVLAKIGEKFAGSSVAQVSDNKFLILRTKELSLQNREKIDELLKQNFGSFNVLSVDTVSGTIGPELLSSGLIALGVTIVGIMTFIGYRFRRDFAFCGILALCHDVTIVLGLFAILGIFRGLEVNTLFLTACLTVLGFSIHDTIVVFDRIRENTKYLSKKRSFTQIINESINQVWFRSLCTSLTTLITLGCLFVFGGETTKIFAGAMFVGILTGTYSSLFVAAVALGKWTEKQAQKKSTRR